MAKQGILFDLYGTLINIETDESMEEIYRGVANYLTYQAIYLQHWELKELYYRIIREQKDESAEEYPEINLESIWTIFLERQGVRSAPSRKKLATVLAQMYRGLSRKRLQLYSEVSTVLDELRGTYRMAVVSDGQPCYVLPELRAVGLDGYFDPIVISADYGFRKPDRRMIQRALNIMNLTTSEVLFVGNDMYRDIYSANQLGIQTIFFASNQGEQSYGDTTPDCVVTQFKDVLAAVQTLS